jgi:hypothetical protein
MRPLKDNKRLYGWGENTPFAWKISSNNGGREAQNGPPFLPQNVMLLFYVLPIYVFHTYLIDFSFLKIRNGSHDRLPISKPSHWLHEISISKIVCHHFQPRLIPHYKLRYLFKFQFIRWGGATHVLFSFFRVVMSHFDWPITKKQYLGGSPN